MAEPFFITTAIDYTNGAPHIGHAYEKVLADVIARYHRLKGDEVFLLTGVDQHGQKVQQSAEKQGVAPQEFVDGITAKFQALWQKLGIEYDGWAATTDPKHKECVRAILQRLWDDQGADGQSKWIYKKSEGGYYSVRQEQFLTDKERGADGEFGAEWQPVEFREEENFYFRLLDHKQWLLDLIDARSAAGKPLVIPDFRVAELRNAVEKLEGDLCISRPAARLQWGIPFPESFGAGFVTYVWFDALVNYLSFAPGYDPTSVAAVSDRRTSPGNGGPPPSPADATDGQRPPLQDFRRWWPALHVIGKDILIPAHGVYWPIMLKALGFDGDDIPTLLVHGWWNISGAKMSKSLGNVIDPDVLADKYGVEAVRYYLMSDIRTGSDADFSTERLEERYNTDLANDIGNLLNRTLPMIHRYCKGEVRQTSAEMERLINSSGVWRNDPGTTTIDKAALFRKQLSESWVPEYECGFCKHDVQYSLVQVWHMIRSQNAFIQISSPWVLAKNPEQHDLLHAVLYHLAESLRIIAILLSPVLIKAAHGIFDQLNWKMDFGGKDERFRLADAVWGELPDGHQLGQPTPLFPRIEAVDPG